MNDHQRKMARKAKKPAGYRDGGRIRGYEDGGPVKAVDEMRQKAIRDEARKSEALGLPPGPPEMREKALRDSINADFPPKSGRQPVIIRDKSNRFIRG